MSVCMHYGKALGLNLDSIFTNDSTEKRGEYDFA